MYDGCDVSFRLLLSLLSDFSPPAFWATCRGRAAANATLCAAHFAAAGRGLDGNLPEGDESAAAAAAAEFAIRCRLVALWQLRSSLGKLAGTLHVYIIER